MRDDSCRSPIENFKKMQYWHRLQPTPDLFIGGCPYNEADFNFWDATTTPYEGNNFLGIWGRWDSNNAFFAEGIATSLTEPLEAGQTYFFEMALRNQGSYQGSRNCTMHPDKHIDLYISEDRIEVVNNYGTGTASATTPIATSLRPDVIQNEESDGWTLVSGCFEAEGGENFFALIMPLGTFGELPVCAMGQAGTGVFRSFYFYIDALSITEFLPEKLEAQITECENRAYEVDLLEAFDDPLLDGASFVWDDGGLGESRELTETRTYTIEAQVGCGSISLTLDVIPFDCSAVIYVPNAFSPNSDGYNDLFQAFLAEESSITNFQLTVFGRWGNIVFQSNHQDIGWNGKSQNLDVPSGVYGWLLSYEVEEVESVKRVIESGDVLIVR